MSDLIDQKAVINACRQIVGIAVEVRNSHEMNPVKSDSIYQRLFAVKQILEELPTIQQERTATRTGLDGPNSIFDLYECSNCGHADSKRNKYCPMCGAKFTQEDAHGED